MSERLLFVVDQEFYKARLDEFLFDKLRDLSRMYLRELIKTERCEVNGRHENSGHKLKPNDLIEIDVDPSRSSAMRAEDIPIDIVYEDGSIMVINKPPGMLVHPTHREKNGTLLNGLAYYLNHGGGPVVRAGLVHRLDKQTSGLLLVAKNVRAHGVLADHFKRKLVEKRYMALVDGSIEPDEGIIDAPVGRYPELKLWSIKADGKPASTRFWVRERKADSTLVELEPVTGRTNQLRIHCESIGHPIVGDIERGGREYDRLCLHAWKLSVRHPVTREILSFSSPVTFDGSARTVNAERTA